MLKKMINAHDNPRPIDRLNVANHHLDLVKNVQILRRHRDGQKNDERVEFQPNDCLHTLAKCSHLPRQKA